jgi:N-methylhydantoinase A
MSMRLSDAMPATEFAVAVDIGGTFTDIALHDRVSGRVWRAKTPSVPSDPSQAFMTGVRLALESAGAAAPALQRVLHGTTVATNIILEGKGARAALVTTAGFRHVLAIGRQDIPRRANLYSWIKPRRPVPPSRVIEVIERVGPGGVVLTELDEASVYDAAEACRQKRSRSALCTPSPIRHPNSGWQRSCAQHSRVSQSQPPATCCRWYASMSARWRRY